jgi:hypothetical protein
VVDVGFKSMISVGSRGLESFDEGEPSNSCVRDDQKWMM